MSWDIVVGIVKHPPELRLFFDHISAEFLQIASTLEINPLKKEKHIHVSNLHHHHHQYYPHLKKILGPLQVQRIKTKIYTYIKFASSPPSISSSSGKILGPLQVQRKRWAGKLRFLGSCGGQEEGP